MDGRRVVVLGAGVAGLTTALLLAQDASLSITVVGKHLPGDFDIEYASPVAGANFAPVSQDGTQDAEYDKRTWPELLRLTKVPEAGVHLQDKHTYFRAKDANSATGKWLAEIMKQRPWFADMMPNFRTLSQAELPAGVDSGIACTSVCINTAIYLPYLLGQCVKRGAVVRRGVVSHILHATSLHHTGLPAEVVVNCTGLFSAKLGGVADSAVYPIRGHVVLVRNETIDKMVFISGTDDAEDETTYIMKRAVGGGMIIGGTYQIGETDPTPSPEQGERILRRAVKLCPEVAGGKGYVGLDVVRHVVGLRPARKGGIRVQAERLGKVWAVHNYGHGGAGYQSSYGSAAEAAKLVHEALACRPNL